MKKLFAILLMFAGFFLSACGTCPDEPPVVIPPGPPPVDDPVDILNAVGFSCISVDNDQVCSGVEDPEGIWNSGPVQITGNPMPVDYLNIEITNYMTVNATVFVHADILITGCWDDTVTFQAIELSPGGSSSFTARLWNYRCGQLGYQESVISIYNAAGFDPTGMNPTNYPRNDLITNAVVYWDNRVPGDMP
jgi:hypothetical protein